MMTGTSDARRAASGSMFEPAHAGHVDVGQDQDQRRLADLGGARQRRQARRAQTPSGSGRRAARAGTAAGTAPRRRARHRRRGCKRSIPASGSCRCAASVRGSVMMNSVNDAGLGVDVDRAAMLLHDDVVAHRQAKPGALARRLGGEERIEHLLLHLGRNAGAVVADADFDVVAEVLGGRASASARSPRPRSPCAWSRHRSHSRSG